MIKKTFILLVILGGILLGYGCYFSRPMKETRDNFTYCYDGKYNGLDSLINTRGYYKTSRVFYKNEIRNTSSNNYMFFEDGFFIYRFNPITNDGVYGHYLLSNDTIKAQYLYNPLGVNGGIHEVWFKIINKNRIKPLYQKAWTKINENEVNQFTKINEYIIDTAQFIPVEKLPNADRFWIKRQEFFWCDKEKYKNFMAKVKREKIKKYNDFRHK